MHVWQSRGSWCRGWLIFWLGEIRFVHRKGREADLANVPVISSFLVAWRAAPIQLVYLPHYGVFAPIWWDRDDLCDQALIRQDAPVCCFFCVSWVWVFIVARFFRAWCSLLRPRFNFIRNSVVHEAFGVGVGSHNCNISDILSGREQTHVILDFH